jgi:hypothetical protein
MDRAEKASEVIEQAIRLGLKPEFDGGLNVVTLPCYRRPREATRGHSRNHQASRRHSPFIGGARGCCASEKPRGPANLLP